VAEGVKGKRHTGDIFLCETKSPADGDIMKELSSAQLLATGASPGDAAIAS
jgi:hypothetical protein